MIGVLSSDDIYANDALDAVIRHFQSNPSSNVLYGQANQIDGDDRCLGRVKLLPPDIRRLRESCCLCASAVFFRRQLFEQHGPIGCRS